MTEVKICGLRRLEDIAMVNKSLPEYAGFVFAESKRQVSIVQANELIKRLDKNIKSVGVFVNSSVDEVLSIVSSCGLDIVQLHGDESQEYINELINNLHNVRQMAEIHASFNISSILDNSVEAVDLHLLPKPTKVWKAQRIKDIDTLEALQINRLPANINAIVLDAFEKDNYGGTGKAFDWQLAADIGKHQKVVLAGGLTTENVLEAIKIINPTVVDVSSGVETDGWKDETKIRNFIRRVRNNE